MKTLTGLDIRMTDVRSDEELRRAYRIARAALLHERPDAPIWTEREAIEELRGDDPAELVEGYSALSDNEMVGAAIFVAFRKDNLEKAFIEVWVEPERRNQGIGTALAEHLVDVARERGRTTVLAQACYPFDRRDDHPYRRFLEGLGFQVALTQVRRDLTLPVPSDRIQSWIDEAAGHHHGYRIEQYVGLLPDELLPSFCYVSNQLPLDAPQGDETWEAESMTPDDFKAKHELHLAAGRRQLHTVALDEATGQVVAYTTLSVTDEDPVNAHQWGTLVQKEHRGHRLGLAIKAHALADLQRRYPGRRRISTTNAEVNASMVGINERMGFVPVEIEGEFQRKLS
jgi:GNAT superfamily N-acetyltransferase